MEKLNQIAKRVSPQNNLPALSLKTSAISRTEKGETFLSVYTGELTPKVVIKGMATIKGAFPQLPLEYFQILSERFRENGFGDDRLQDAIKHVVDNCVYPTPTIANFISYDKKVRLFTYHEMLSKVHEAGGSASVWNAYEMTKIKGTNFWFLKSEEFTK